jgi:16S rRNA A1518/A1519 N6-dimethyltransferase RsmA/KsgA/DIM1 with predicted DNA glycosylase/AP lyase activity
MICIAEVILILFALLFITFFIIPFLFGAPFDITREKSLKNIIRLTNPKKGDKIAELGSGDGRVCIALAQKIPKNNKNTIIHGFEINPILVLISRRKIRKLNLQHKIKIYWKNFWRVNLHSYNKIVLFQFRTIMKKLEKKLKKELKPKSMIISHNWIFPDWKIKKQAGTQHALYGKVYLYEK